MKNTEGVVINHYTLTQLDFNYIGDDDIGFCYINEELDLTIFELPIGYYVTKNNKLTEVKTIKDLQIILNE